MMHDITFFVKIKKIIFLQLKSVYIVLKNIWNKRDFLMKCENISDGSKINLILLFQIKCF